MKAGLLCEIEDSPKEGDNLKKEANLKKILIFLQIYHNIVLKESLTNQLFSVEVLHKCSMVTRGGGGGDIQN